MLTFQASVKSLSTENDYVNLKVKRVAIYSVIHL